MRVGVHEADARRHIAVIFYLDLFIHNKEYVVSDIDAVVDDKLRLVENAAAKYVDFPKEIDVMADEDLGVTHDEGHLGESEPLTDSLTATAEQRLSIKVRRGPTKERHSRLVQAVKQAKQWIEGARQGKITSHHSFGGASEEIKKRCLSTLNLQDN
jgi:hypothetical protein